VLFLAFRMEIQDQIPYSLLPWFFSYLLLMILMMGSMNTAVGSACGDIKDLQNLTFPAMLPVLIPMFCFMAVLREPSSTFAVVLSLIPPFTPMLMLLRQALPGGVPAWQPWAGLAGVVLMTVLVIWAGSRIFRVAILIQGKTPKLGRFLKWAIRG
jgi:ABC-2 type transport system permease protein